MDIGEIKKDMFVECQQGIGKVLVVDEATSSVLIEQQATREQLAVEAKELSADPQLHNGCDQYY